jgi:hypothetical protein
MHTARGRWMGRAYRHFYEEGARIENAADVPDPEEDARAFPVRPRKASEDVEQLELGEEQQ